MKKLIATIFVFILHSNAKAFNEKKCWNNVISGGDASTIHHTKSTTLEITSMPTGSTISVTEFSTSTGSCAAIGRVEYEKKLFIAYSFKQIQKEAAIGLGPSLNTLAFYYGQKSHKKFSQLMQNNYAEIYSTDLKTVNEFNARILKLVQL